MAAPLLRSRQGCALHGALFTALAIDGVVPIIHSTAGCGEQAYRLLSPGDGFAALAGGGAACSAITEKHVVFGGSSRLREQIKNTLGVMDGDVFVVLSGCAVEMIGDDIPAMVKEAQDQGHAVIEIASAGFRGSAHHGYECLLKGLAERLDVLGERPGGRLSGLVNILGLVPHQDAFWFAEIDELCRMLAGIGLRPNPLFGPSGGVQGLRDLGRAEISLVLSPWGESAARALEERFGIAWLSSDGLPVGARESRTLLLKILAAMERESADAGLFLDAETAREDYALDLAAESLYRQGPQDFALVGAGIHVAGLARFLTGALGWHASAVVATDVSPGGAGATSPDGEERIVTHTGDCAVIEDIVNASGADILLASGMERSLAQDLGIPLIEVSFPLSRHLGLSGGFGGFRGGINLIENVAGRGMF